MSFTEELREMAIELIAEVSKTEDASAEEAFWIRRTKGPLPDDNTPWVAGPDVETEIKTNMVFLLDDRDKRESKNYKDRSSTSKGNTTVYVSDIDFEPKLSDSIRRGSTIYQIESINEVKPNSDKAITYKVRVS